MDREAAVAFALVAPFPAAVVALPLPSAADDDAWLPPAAATHGVANSAMEAVLAEVASSVCVGDVRGSATFPQLSVATRKGVLEFVCEAVDEEDVVVVFCTTRAEDVVRGPLHKFFTQSLDMLCLINYQGCFEYINPAFTEVLGFTEAELKSQTVISRNHPDDVQQTREMVAKVNQGGVKIVKFINRLICKDGTYRTLIWSISSDDTYKYGVARDITELDARERELRASKEQLQEVLAATGNLYLTCAADATIVSCNSVVLRRLGCADAAAIVGTPLANWIPDLVRIWPEILCRYDEIFSSGDPESFVDTSASSSAEDTYDTSTRLEIVSGMAIYEDESLPSHRDFAGPSAFTGREASEGSTISGCRILIVLRNANAFFDSETSTPVDVVVERKDYNSYAVTVTDVSARVRASLAAAARRKADEAQMIKAQFLANVSHELCTPLNGILGMVSLLATSALNPAQTSHLQVIKRSASALLALLQDLLTFAQADAGQLSLNYAPFSPAELIANLAVVFRTSARAAGKNSLQILSGVDPAELAPTIYGDSRRVRQVLLNLLSNAVKFTHDGDVSINATLTPVEDPSSLLPGSCPPDAPPAAAALFGDGQSESPATTADDDIPWASLSPAELVVTVADTGIGMSPDLVAKIFTPYSQADTSITRKYGGTGLGLVVVKEVTALCGGSVTVTSTPGAGSTFSVSFIVALPTAPYLSPAPSALAPPVATVCILGRDVEHVSRLTDAFLAPPRLAATVDPFSDPFDAVVAIRNRRTVGQPYDALVLSPDSSLLSPPALIAALAKYHPQHLAAPRAVVVLADDTSLLPPAANLTVLPLAASPADVAGAVRAAYDASVVEVGTSVPDGDHAVVSAAAVVDACGGAAVHAAPLAVVSLCPPPMCAPDLLTDAGVGTVTTYDSLPRAVLGLARLRATGAALDVVIVPTSMVEDVGRLRAAVAPSVRIVVGCDDGGERGPADGVMPMPSTPDSIREFVAAEVLLRARALALSAVDLAPRELSVLVVDDLLVNRIVLGAILSELGVSTIDACNGQEMLDIVATRRADIAMVFLDCHMPVMGGCAAARALRAAEADDPTLGHLPVTAVTADMGAADEVAASGMDYCLFKPISVPDIHAIAVLLVADLLPDDPLPPSPPLRLLADLLPPAIASIAKPNAPVVTLAIGALALSGFPGAAATLALAATVATGGESPLLLRTLLRRLAPLHIPSTQQ